MLRLQEYDSERAQGNYFNPAQTACTAQILQETDNYNNNNNNNWMNQSGCLEFACNDLFAFCYKKENYTVLIPLICEYTNKSLEKLHTNACT